MGNESGWFNLMGNYDRIDYLKVPGEDNPWEPLEDRGHAACCPEKLTYLLNNNCAQNMMSII
jgi:hypothetical protein